jgi:predicted exporter
MVGGLSVDYAVFLREDDARGTGLRGVALCFGTDLAGFALLATAAVPVLSQIGSTVAVGCTLSFLFGLAFTAPRAGRPA